MFKIYITKNEQKYCGRFETEEECLSWRQSKHPDSSYTIEDVTSVFKISQLWNDVDTWMENQMDSNSRTSINLMLADASISEARKNKILLFAAWWQSGWEYYATVKAALQIDPTTTWDCAVNIGLCPVDIWDIAGTP